jgi:hypothetical protein
MKRITPENITSLKSNEIFVFGSNEAGIHGSGAARLAHDRFGACTGIGFGGRSRSFAIPTKDWYINTLPLKFIEFYVDRFIDYARLNKSLTFLVTKIGCGLAGYTPEDIAPLFKQAINVKNIYLPKEFWDILNKENEENTK